MEFQANLQIDRFRLVRRLGQGGQGEVWQASDLLAPGRQVALKRVASLDRVDRERARREAHRLASLQHPGLVTCFQILEPPDRDDLILVMELVEGVALDALLTDPRLTQGHREALLLQTAHALAALHQAGIVHRDLKPANLIVRESFWRSPGEPGAVKLVDLGISTEIGNPAPLTGVAQVIGTSPTIAPEALLPDTFRAGAQGPAPAADVFAWGVLAWTLFFARHPTGLSPGSSLTEYALAYLHARANPAWASSPLPAPLGPLLQDCLSIDPDRRVQSASEIVHRLLAARTVTMTAPTAAALLAAQAGPPAPTAPAPTVPAPTAPPPATRSSHEFRWLLLAALLLLAGVFLASFVSGLTWILLDHDSSSPSERPSPPGLFKPGPCACGAESTQRCGSRRTTTAPHRCGAPLPPGTRWKLSPSFITVTGHQDLSTEDPRAIIKFCKGGTEICKSIYASEFAASNPHCGRHYDLLITTEDLTLHGIDIHVLHESGRPRWQALRNIHPPLGAEHLCRGVVFSPSQSAGIVSMGFNLHEE
jgi:serine/threonine protein kinase